MNPRGPVNTYSIHSNLTAALPEDTYDGKTRWLMLYPELWTPSTESRQPVPQMTAEQDLTEDDFHAFNHARRLLNLDPSPNEAQILAINNEHPRPIVGTAGHRTRDDGRTYVARMQSRLRAKEAEAWPQWLNLVSVPREEEQYDWDCY